MTTDLRIDLCAFCFVTGMTYAIYEYRKGDRIYPPYFIASFVIALWSLIFGVGVFIQKKFSS